MDVELIRAKVRAREYLVYDHVITEAFKDGLSVRNVLYVILNGKVIEDYPDRCRALFYAALPNGLPAHVLVDYAHIPSSDLEIVTTYVPDSREWINFQIRKPKGRFHR